MRANLRRGCDSTLEHHGDGKTADRPIPCRRLTGRLRASTWLVDAIDESMDPDEWLMAQISLALQQLVGLHIRLDALRKERLFDLEIQLAMLTAMWMKARILIEFLQGNTTESARLSEFIQSGRWKAPKPYRKRLEEYRGTATNYVAHVKVEPKGNAGMSDAMPADMVACFRSLLDWLREEPETQALADLLHSSVVLSERMLASPDAHFMPERDLFPGVVLNLTAT